MASQRRRRRALTPRRRGRPSSRQPAARPRSRVAAIPGQPANTVRTSSGACRSSSAAHERAASSKCGSRTRTGPREGAAVRPLSPTPLVSIVTPSYNTGRFIEETLRSVQEQDYPRVEHIVLDSGSTDETPEILARFPSGQADRPRRAGSPRRSITDSRSRRERSSPGSTPTTSTSRRDRKGGRRPPGASRSRARLLQLPPRRRGEVEIERLPSKQAGFRS